MSDCARMSQSGDDQPKKSEESVREADQEGPEGQKEQPDCQRQGSAERSLTSHDADDDGVRAHA